MTLLLWLAAPAVGFLLGSIPTAWLIARAKLGIDIRKHGSGNVGATNLARVAGFRWGLICFLLDMLKGLLPTAAFLPATLQLARLYRGPDETLALIAGLSAVIGHMYTPWLEGSGGKGVSTACGIFCALAPGSMFTTILVFLAVGPLATRTISAGAVVAAIVLPLLTYTHSSRLVFGVALVVAIMVIYRHRGNIGRLLKGTESRTWEGQP